VDEKADGDIKGAVLQSRLALVRSRLGDAGIARVLARLSPGDRRRLTDAVMPMAWYPFALNEVLDHAIATEMGQGAQSLRMLGAQSAQDNLGESHKIYVKSHDPHGLLKSTAQIYKLYYRTGYRTYEWVSPTHAILRTFESKSFSASDCLTVVGWHEKAIDMCGGRDARVQETACRAKGGGRCEYLCEWRAPASSRP